MIGSARAHYDGITAFFETVQTTDLEAIAVMTLVLHGEDDQIVPIADSALKSIKLLKNGTLTTYPGYPHGMGTVPGDVLNPDLLAFVEAVSQESKRLHRAFAGDAVGHRRLCRAASRQDEGHRLAAALAAAEGLAVGAPILAPAASWWARTTVPSTKCKSHSGPTAVSPSALQAYGIRAQAPARYQRPKREQALAAVVILNGVWMWNDFFLGLILLTKEDAYTLPVAIMAFRGSYSSAWGLIFASVIISIFPVLIAYVLLSRQFIAGLTAGSVKG